MESTDQLEGDEDVQQESIWSKKKRDLERWAFLHLIFLYVKKKINKITDPSGNLSSIFAPFIYSFIYFFKG